MIRYIVAIAFPANVVPVIGAVASQRLLDALIDLERITDTAAVLRLGVVVN
ncbi:hypothetical protein [Rhizobium rhizogenes]|uniref:hypothetical protein n=1 Tax=Rhizobium rhizogenes TaxID=359 RepID=UPI000AD9FF96|nr:hypothetical protein [Rhizobium rhizogenes]MDJ1637631.1 hypothetical protein [Rhizobium rhizogenes]NTI46566.1 hypothetical protein [Rhizobium rhizogenes]